MQERYVEMVTSGIDLARTDLKFVVDAGNGAGGPLGVAAMKKLGLEPDPLFCEMDGRFPEPSPGSDRARRTSRRSSTRVEEDRRARRARLDGDADRLGAVDANGEIVWGDKLMILFSRALLAEQPGAAILGEVKCSQTLYDDIAKHGGRPIVWKTGHSLIKTKMKEEGALLAGEMSGHLFFADRYFGFDDAIYASLRLLEILASDREAAREMLADVPRTFATPEIRVDCPDALKFDVVAACARTTGTRGYPSSTSTARASRSARRATRRGASCARRTRARSSSCASRPRAPSGATQMRAEVDRVVAKARAALASR